MSHLVTIKTQVRSEAILHRAVKRCGCGAKVTGMGKHFIEGRVVEGVGLTLPGTHHQIRLAFDLKTGAMGANADDLYYDTHKKLIDQLVQSYAVEAILSEAERQGQVVQEELLADGSVKLTILEA